MKNQRDRCFKAEGKSIRKGYYGVDPEQSLLSVNFATTENTYLNEHYSEESKESVDNQKANQ